MANREKFLNLSASVAALLSCTATPHTARAEPAVSLDEVVVTARRKEEDLQRTPVSVTALSTNALRDLDVQDISQLSDHVPNLNLVSSTSFGGSSTAYAFIRGIGQQDIFVQNDPGVGIYVDGVYIGRSQGAVFDVVDLQRVEVLRGPQGTLYGRNTIGGAINLVTEPPSRTTKGYAEIEGGNYGRLNARTRISGPLSESLSGSVTLARISHDGYVKAKFDPACPNCSHDALTNEDTWAARAALRYQPTDELTVDLGGDYSLRHNRSIGSRLAFYGGFYLPAPGGGVYDAYNAAVAAHWGGRSAASFVNLTPNTHQSDYTGWDHQRASGVNLTGTYTANGTTFKSISAYRRLRVNDASDSDDSPLAQANEVGELTDQFQLSQEFQLSSRAFDHLDWIVGLFGMREKATNVIIQAQQFAEMSIIPPFAPPTFLPFLTAVPSACFNASEPPLFGCGLLNGTSGESDTDYRVHSVAAYANGTLHLTPELSLSAGLRFNIDRKFFRYTNVANFPPLFFDTSAEWHSTTPRAGIEYQVTPDALLYASYSQGFKSGTFNNGTDPNYPLSVQPEKVSAYEVGAKTSWLDRRLTANLAGYYTNYTNMQMQVQTNFVRQYRAWINVGGARIYGFELEVAARPLPHLQFNASVGNTTSKVTSIQPIAQYDPVSNPAGVVALGARLLHTPLFSTDLGATVDFPIGASGSLVTRFNWSSKSSQEGDLLNSAVARVAGYNVANLRISYQPVSDRWEVYVLSDNVFDKKYEVARYSFSPSLVAGAVDGTPRTIAAGVHVRL